MVKVTDIEAERRAGIEAINAGRWAAARDHLEQACSQGPPDAASLVALALAHRNLSEAAAMHAAVDRALAADPRNLLALILKGDCLVGIGQKRVAVGYYGAAVAMAERTPNLPPGIAQAVRNATEARDWINRDLEAHIRSQLSKTGFDEHSSSRRFADSLDMLAGRKQVYFQQPRAYFFPELPQVQFYPGQDFPWLAALESKTDEICAELEAVAGELGVFTPYMQRGGPGPVNPDARLAGSEDWTACHLVKNGVPIAEHLAKCPATMAALEGVPLMRVPGRSPNVLFSRMRAGAHIAPHVGFLNARLICHLPLVVPPGCHLRVGNEQREFRRGKAWVFDDTIEHEARNQGSEARTILIFDIWRPELSDEERGLVSSLMEALDSFDDGSSMAWSN